MGALFFTLTAEAATDTELVKEFTILGDLRPYTGVAQDNHLNGPMLTVWRSAGVQADAILTLDMKIVGNTGQEPVEVPWVNVPFDPVLNNILAVGKAALIPRVPLESCILRFKVKRMQAGGADQPFAVDDQYKIAAAG